MSVLAEALERFRAPFLEAVNQLSGKDLAGVYLAMVKEAGDQKEELSAGELLAMLSDQTRANVISDLQLQGRSMPVQSTMQREVHTSNTGNGAKAPGGSDRGNNNRPKDKGTKPKRW